MPTAYERSLARLRGEDESEESESQSPVVGSAYERSLKRLKGGKDEDTDTDGFISRVVESALKQTSVGIAAQAAGVVGPPPENLGTVENIAAGIGGFVLDPATYLTGGLGGIIGKQAAKKLVTYAAKKGLIGTAARVAPSAIAAGTQLGGLEAVREVAGGELHPGEIAKATIAGAAFGPAGMLPKGLRTAGEVVAMGAVPPLLEARLPTGDDWVHAAGTVGGFKLYRLIKGALSNKFKGQSDADAVASAVGEEDLKRIKAALEAPQPTGPVTEVERKLSAFADSESISRSQYAEATGTTGKVPSAVDREAEVIVAAAKVEREKQDVEIKTPEAIPAEAAEEGSEAQGKGGDVLKTPEWVADAVEQNVRQAEQFGVVEQIEQLSAERLTASQISARLKDKMPNLDNEARKGIVYAVRNKRGIPSMEEGAEFENWLSQRQAAEEGAEAQGKVGDVLTDLDLKRQVKEHWEKGGVSSKVRSLNLRPAFRDQQTGEVFHSPTAGVHSLSVVPERYWLETEPLNKNEVMPTRVGPSIEAGFIDPSGKFYTRTEADNLVQQGSPSQKAEVEPVLASPVGDVGAKQPWEQSKAEFVHGALREVDASRIDALRKVEREIERAWDKPRPVGISAVQHFLSQERIPKELRSLRTQYSVAKKNVETGSEGESRTKEAVHRRLVENAVSQSKSVPASVLADYPDLKPVERQQGTKVDRAKAITDLPLERLPPEVAEEIQAEAKAQLEARGSGGLMRPRIKSVKTREALQRIVRDRGEDVGAEVKRQKARLLEYLKGDKDFRTIYEKDFAPEPESSAIIESYLQGATDKQLSVISAELGYGPRPDLSYAASQREVLPDWVTQRQPGEVEVPARPGLFGQETFDPMTGRQAELPLAARPESPPPDVKGQGVLPESPKVQAARAEADAKWAEFDAYKKKNPTLFSTGVDVKALGLFASAIKSEIKAGYYKFAEFVERIIQKIGKTDAKAFEPQIRKAWDDARANDPRLDASTELKPILDASTAPEFPAATTPRPRGLADLAEQGRTESRRGAMRGVTELRTMVGEPTLVTHAEQKAIAAKRLAENPEAWKQKFLEGDWVPTDASEVQMQKMILEGLPETPELAQGYLAWELGGTEQGRALEARRMANQPIEVGQRFFARQAVHQPPPPTAKKMKAAQDRVKRERARQPKPHPLTAAEIPQPVGMMPAPPGVRLPSKPPVQGPETQRNYEARVARAAKKAQELAAQWQLEVAQNKAKLSAMGYDVDRAMRGELDPIAQQEFIRDAAALKSTRMDQAYEVWRNAILSGPATQVTNVVGTAAHGAWYFTAERMADAVVSSAARAMGYKNEGAYFGEIGHVARAMLPAMGKAWSNFLTTWRTEIPQFYLSRGLELETPYGHRAPAIPGKLGKRIRAIGYRPLSAFDDLTKTLVAEMETAGMAYRQARNEGLRGKDLDARMRELVADQGSEAHLRGTDTAIRLSFQETTDALKKITGITQQEGVRWLIPFTTTPFNILKTGIRKSPFGALKLAKEVWKARESGDWTHVHPRVAEQVLAWGTTLALAYMNDPADPWITGGTDPNRKYAIKIGGQWYSYGRMEPFATTLGLLVDGINKIHAGADLFESVKAPFDALLDRVDNQTFFAGISDFMKAVRYGDANYVLDWASKFPASWVPNLVRAPIRAASDETPQRRVWGRGALRAENSLKRGLQAFEVMPGHPRYDLWGRAIPKDGSPVPGTDWIFRTLSPVGQKKYVETIGDRLLTKWNAANPTEKAAFKPPNPYFNEDGKEHYYTDDEYATYVRESGRLTQQRVIAAEARGGLNMNNPTQRDIDRLEKIIDTSRTRIRNALKRARRKAERNAA